LSYLRKYKIESIDPSKVEDHSQTVTKFIENCHERNTKSDEFQFIEIHWDSLGIYMRNVVQLELSTEQNLWTLLADMPKFHDIFPYLKEIFLVLTLNKGEHRGFEEIIKICQFGTYKKWMVRVTGFSNS
jgi:hypothetical protein